MEGPDRAAARRLAAGLAVLLALTTAAYAPSLDGEFVWDDVILIRDNPALRTLEGAWAAATGDFFRQSGASLPASGYRRPLPTLLNAATLWLAGTSPLPFRLTNLALHLLAVALALLALVRLGLAPTPAVLGAGLFALHPVQTEAVAFISGRTDLLAAVFALASLLAYLHARRRGGYAAPAAGLVAFALAGLSKEVAWMLPAALLALERAGLVAPHGRRRRGLLAGYATVLALLLLPRLLGAVPGVERLYFPAERLPVVVPNLAATYARLLVWPTELRALYDDLPVARAGALTAIGAAVLVALAVAALQRGAPRLAAGAAWIGSFLLPVLHLVPIPTLAAERYLYLPALGLGLLLAATIEAARPRTVALGAAAAALVVAGLGTAVRAADWRDGVTLWSAEVARDASGFKAWHNLAAALAESGRRDEAAAALERAWRLKPGHPTVFRNLVRLELVRRGAPGLTPSQRAAFLEDALAASPHPDRLADWVAPLERAGRPHLARWVAEMAAARRAAITPSGDPTP